MIVSTFAFLTCVVSAFDIGDERTPIRDTVLIDEYGPCGATTLFLACKLKGVTVEWDYLQTLVGPSKDNQHSFETIASLPG